MEVTRWQLTLAILALALSAVLWLAMVAFFAPLLAEQGIRHWCAARSSSGSTSKR